MKNTSDKFKQESINSIYQILQLNEYPRRLIDNLFRKYNKPIIAHTNPTSTTFKSLTYTPHLSEKLQRLFQSYNPNLKIGFKPHCIINTILNRTNSATHNDDRHSVIYKIDCLDCEGTYIGQTGRKLKDRILEHTNDVRKKRTSKNQTAVVTHFQNTGHTFNFENPQILAVERQLNKRLTHESIHINLHKKTCVNLKSDIDSLNPTYTALLNHIQQKRKQK